MPLRPVARSRGRRRADTPNPAETPTRAAALSSRRLADRIRSRMSLLALLCVGGLVSAAALPALAVDPAPSVEASADRQAGQALSVSASALAGAATRDGYQVTLMAATKAFSLKANTFVNDPNSPIQWPFTEGSPITDGFGYRSCAGCSSYHTAIDFTPGEGTPIQSIADGVVVETGGPDGSFGQFARIEYNVDGQRIVALYAHMLAGSSPLTVGQTVSVGQLVGQVGNTGQSTGPHLHFGLFVNGVDPIDPFPWLAKYAGGAIGY